ncbi:hypothetical protein HMPREF1092_03015 [Clostridium thermobutyricum]|uniref:Uncharacterized protein n=1 Tax=Clostridium thermobutyricum TaxID=29372 RepID=N9XVA9_9CLOT|nr:hypothetical protein [Clostridium thermobutyricum]ENY99878.1 hypothetical protein HMPREF1092_03015 [Clostridium thermobutyricum]
MFNKLKRNIQKLYSAFLKTYSSTRFLIIIFGICLILISISVFFDINQNEGLITIRTIFASIIGFLIEISSSKVICNDRTTIIRNYIVGSVSLLIVFILILDIIYYVSPINPSLMLLRNTLFSCVGFLISCSKYCESDH